MAWVNVGQLFLRDTPTAEATVVKTLKKQWGGYPNENNPPIPAAGNHGPEYECSGDLTVLDSGALESPLPHGVKAVLLTIKLKVTIAQQPTEAGHAYLEVALRKKGGVDFLNYVHRVEAVKTQGTQGADAMAPNQEGFVCVPVQVTNGEFEILTMMGLRGPVWRMERTLYVTGFYM
ncbi:MAG: hypothetical protein NVSMB9_31220 [Isosphaeraceae bacterium]